MTFDNSGKKIREFLPIVFLVFLLSPLVSKGQEKYVSLEELQLIIDSGDDDSNRQIDEAIKVNRRLAPDTVFSNTLELAREHYLLQLLNKKAVALGIELIQITKKLGQKEKLAKHYNKLLLPLHTIGEYEKQYAYTQRAMHYAKQFEDTLQLMIATAHLGTFYWHIDELDEAVKYNKEACKLAATNPNFDRRAILLNNRATYYYYDEMYDKALETLYAAKDKCLSNFDSTMVYSGLGIVYYLTDSLALSEKYLNLSHSIANDFSKSFINANWLYHMGILSYKQGNFDESERYLEQAVQKLEKSTSIEFLQKGYYTLYKIANSKGDNNRAFRYLELSYDYKDSLEATQNIDKLASQYYRNTILKKEREKAETKRVASALEKKVVAEKSARLYSNVMVVVAIIALIILGFWGWNYRKLQRLKQLQMQRQFSDKMELKNKQLASVHVRNIKRSNQLRRVDSKLSEISGKYSDKSAESNEELDMELNRIKRMLQSDSDLEWKDFHFYFDQINDGYFARVQAKHPKITNNDKKIIAYIKIGLETRQIAKLLNVTESTAYTQRYRLRKKLNLSNEEDLIRYLQTSFEKGEE